MVYLRILERKEKDGLLFKNKYFFSLLNLMDACLEIASQTSLVEISSTVIVSVDMQK